MMFTRAQETLKHLEALKSANATREAEDRKEQLLASLRPVAPFPEGERSEQAKRQRIERSEKDFWYWDSVYFPAEIYPDYSKPGKFHRDLVKLSDLHDKKAHVVHGPRGFAKTASLKKKFVYDFLFGRRRYMALGSETLDPATTAVLDIRDFLHTNDRILHDFEIDWLEESDEKLFARSAVNPRGTFVTTLSEERSARGKQRGFFQRLDYIYLTDFENLTSSVTEEAVARRIDRLNEMRTSLTDDGTLIWEGNNFDERCAMNYLFREQSNGLLSENLSMHLYSAWDGKRKSLWPEKYPAKTEEQLRAMCQPKDTYDWLGNWQGTPRRKSGEIFPDTHYCEWDRLPDDVRAVIYVDPNCSLKGKGDTTAMPCFGFSAKNQQFFLTAARCRSYADTNELLLDLLMLRQSELDRKVRVIVLGFDGHVAQESSWTNHDRNFSQLKRIPLPPIEFKRYRVDDLTKNLQLDYQAGKVFFPPGFRKTDEGKRFTDQFFAFRAKKAKQKDDAPDALICARELLQEEGLVNLTGGMPEIHSFSRRNITDRF